MNGISNFERYGEREAYYVATKSADFEVSDFKPKSAIFVDQLPIWCIQRRHHAVVNFPGIDTPSSRDGAKGVERAPPPF